MKIKLFLGVFLLIQFYVFAGKENNYKIIAYYTGDAEEIQKYPIEKLTHIIFSFLKLQNDTLTFHNLRQIETVRKLVELKKKNPGLKIMVSMGGWSACEPCSDLFSSEQHRKTFAKTAVNLLKKYNLDGLDLDWEYPAIEGFPGHKFRAADRDNFTELLKELRQEMGSKFLLSFAAGGFINYLENSINWPKVIPLVDFVNLMTYDLVGGYSTVTGHHTPLNDYQPAQESTSKCVNWLLDKNIPSEKLIIGAAFYARIWEHVENINHGLFQSGKFLKAVSYKEFETEFSDSSGFIYFWDKHSKAPFRYNPDKKLFATFDDAHSISEKTKFILRNKLGGIMFWELIQDKYSKGLVDEINRFLN